jgi:hypothetical protein
VPANIQVATPADVRDGGLWRNQAIEPSTALWFFALLAASGFLLGVAGGCRPLFPSLRLVQHWCWQLPFRPTYASLLAGRGGQQVFSLPVDIAGQ